ncbi:MAG: arginine--tRNA ligase [Chitinophagaceae bacterium]|nr:MAG: arginine--tRNA ligase [Chitinophagaceae bacterium]
MSLLQEIRRAGIQAIKTLYHQELSPEQLTVNETKPDFEGDYTIVMFSLSKFTKQKPEESGRAIGEWLVSNFPGIFQKYNIVKGFLNLTVADSYYVSFLKNSLSENTDKKRLSNGKKVMVEFASPNTNKPLHLGHLRNIFLGSSIANILKASGYNVIKANLVNDRGIHICKSMIAWLHYGNGETPESTGKKGDHLVGDYYVKFNDVYKEQIEHLVNKGTDKAVAEKEAPIMKEAQELLVKWEQGDKETRELWAKMNGWVYEGFDETYQRMGVSFDKMYYESKTYLLGKRIVEEGLEKNLFFKKEDGSVWVDLTADGLDEKLLLRADGTSVYMTQDLGTAQLKYDDYHIDRSIYVIGDEQNYHMTVLKLILQKLGKPYAAGIDHLSYGMVELPSGRMKSREGTVVDADDLMDEMIATAEKHTRELGKVNDFSEKELSALYEILGMGAAKFYLLRVNPKKKMVFNPEESIDFHGFTGPFVQYTYARIQSILRKEEAEEHSGIPAFQQPLLPLEKSIIIQLEKFEQALENAALEMDPSIIANYAFELAKIFNTFYTEHSVTKAENEEKKILRLLLCKAVAQDISYSIGLLGISVPERM